jgi:hypothetical protein
MQGGKLRIAGTQRATIQAGTVSWFNPPARVFLGAAIHSNDGHVVVDPDVPLNPIQGPSFQGNSTLRFEEMEHIVATHWRPGEWLVADVFGGTPGATCHILISPFAGPAATPFGESWLDSAPFLVGMGTFDANGFMRLIDTIGQLVPPGVVTTVQGVVVDAGEIRLTLPLIAPRGL